MAKRISRSLSLFQPSLNSTATKLEGVVEDEDNEEDTKEPNSNECDDLYLNGEDDEEEDVFPNGQTTTTGRSHQREQLKNDLQFVESLRKYSNERNKFFSYKKVLNGISVEDNNYLSSMTDAELEAKFKKIIKSLGKFRTFYSAVHDMETFLKKSLSRSKHPEEPVAPLHPRLLYLKELRAQGKTAPANTPFMKWSSDCYNKLSVREQSHYIKKHQKMKENYLRQLEDFYERYPNERPKLSKGKKNRITPFNLFYSDLKSEQDCKRVDALNQWNDLPVKKKIGYIKQAYQYQNETDNKVKITIKEKKLLDEHYGKPERPPLTVLSLYKNEYSDPDFHNGYKTLKKDEKRKLKSKLCEMFQKYEKDMNKYIATLNGEAKRIEQDELLKFMCKYKHFSKPLNTPVAERKRSASLTDIVEENVPKKKKKTTYSKDMNYDQIDEITIKPEPKIDTKNKKSPLKKATTVYETKKTQKKAAQSHAEVEIPVVNKEEGKKKDKKPKKQQREFTGVKPPKTLFKYFVSINSNITLDEAKQKFCNLTKSQKKKIEKIYVNLCETYIVQLREYLTSLKESDMQAFITQLEQNKADESDDDLTSSEDESVSSDSE